MSIQRDSGAPRTTARPAELPRVYLDTRMPPAPAAGGRVIVVGAPAPHPGRAGLAMGAVAIVAVAVALLAFRWARHRRPG
ncbi:MAG TPA: hypothetical protein VFY85_02340 [Gemmatimonadaceae bacterium]|nr:hypothetical protein [Gemmatimonadaceae bacterium]